MAKEKKSLHLLAVRALSAVMLIAAILFISAGTIQYRAAWIFLATLICIGVPFALWLYIRTPQQFQNRLHPAEPDKSQHTVVLLIGVALCLSLVVSGLDRRYGWSHLTEWRYIIAVLLIFASVLVYRNVFLCNSFLSNTVEIHEGHKVINQGMYGVVRHPMYLATCMMCAAGLIILGSLFSLPLYILFFCLMYVRAKKEEKQLIDALPEYKTYMGKVKQMLIPFIF